MSLWAHYQLHSGSTGEQRLSSVQKLVTQNCPRLLLRDCAWRRGPALSPCLVGSPIVGLAWAQGLVQPQRGPGSHPA